MTDCPPNSMPKEAPIPLRPIPQVAQAPLSPMPQIHLGSEPCMVTCPSCGASIVTTVTMQPTTQTHLMALLLCLICVCCACVPYCVDSCKSAEHHCPNCNAYLGTQTS